MRNKRLLAALLAAALMAALLLPVSAAESSFADVSDPVTAVNADILRLMGVVNGVGNDQFRPEGTLTRAEFCTMVVRFMQKSGQVVHHSTRTIFTDVTAKHWALGYVNLAASLKVQDGDKQIALVAGVGNGKFEPDSKITLAQAATILVRVLGYSGEQTGAVWPQGYMNLASSIGLTNGLNLGANATITRAQAAQLFVNALSCRTGSGEVYYKTLGSVAEDTIILAVNVPTDDGTSDGAIRTTANRDSETYLAAAGAVKPTALLGKRGALVLNEKSQIVSFVPDDSSAITITLSGGAQPSYVKGTDGKKYTMSANTILYTAGAAEGQPYLDGYTALVSGSQIVMYTENGKIAAVYAGGAGEADQAVVVSGTPNAAMFQKLTGGASGYKIQRSRQDIPLSGLKTNDVVTYDALTNTLVASELRLTCIYEDAYPNAQVPTQITALGHTFEVLDSAWETIGDFSIGSTVTLLLTADGKVAGAARPGQANSNAIGMITHSGAEMHLPNGGKIDLKGNVDNRQGMEGKLVTLASTRKDELTVGTLNTQRPSGAFDVKNMTLGGHTVAAGVRVYEQVGSTIAELSLANLDADSVPAADMELYHCNASGMVDYIVLRAVTGDVYTYGILTEGVQTGGDLLTYTNRTVTLENRGGSVGPMITTGNFKDKSFGGVVKGYGDVDGTPKAASAIQLTEIKGVSPADFFLSQGITYVTADGKTYQVSTEVECYKKATKSWFTNETGEARLAACRAFSSDLTIYVDPIGQKVRIVAAN